MSGETIPLTRDDIVRLGIEAGLRVNAMPEYPSQADIDLAVDSLKMRSVELAYLQRTQPEGIID